MAGLPLFCDPDERTADRLRVESGGIGVVFTSLTDLRDHLMAGVAEDTIVLGPNVSEVEAFALADFMRLERPALGVVLVRAEISAPLLQEAIRAGVREVVDHRDTLGLQSAVKRSAHLAATLRDKAPAARASAPEGVDRSKGRVITVFSAKGGCGKTMLATNLAAALADRGRRRVVIIDLDLTFGDVAVSMQLFPARTIVDAVPLNGSIDASAVDGLLTPHSTGLDVIVAPTEPSAAESIQPVLISHLLDVLRDEFDFIVVDTPGRFDDPVLAALDVSDQIALVATPDVPALKNLKLTLETLVELSYGRDKFRLVLNRADSNVGIKLTEVEKTAQMEIACRIPSSRDVPVSINQGVPIVLSQPKHDVSKAIRLFAEADVAGGADGQNVRRPGASGDGEKSSRWKRRSRA
jgi:pilus assembly protein CpaE